LVVYIIISAMHGHTNVKLISGDKVTFFSASVLADH